MNNEINKNNWKSWVDWAPVYIIIGIALANFTERTGIIQKITDKLWNKEPKPSLVG